VTCRGKKGEGVATEEKKTHFHLEPNPSGGREQSSSRRWQQAPQSAVGRVGESIGERGSTGLGSRECRRDSHATWGHFQGGGLRGDLLGLDVGALSGGTRLKKRKHWGNIFLRLYVLSEGLPFPKKKRGGTPDEARCSE